MTVECICNVHCQVFNVITVEILGSKEVLYVTNDISDEFVLLLYRALWCLDDVPFRNKIPHLKKLPGQVYTIDEQCQRVFGSNSGYCRGVSEVACFIYN